MPPSTKQPNTAAFLTTYEKTLHAFSLTERLSGKYTLINCIKHSSEKEFYLLSDSDSRQYLLKKETSGHSPQLKQEYTMLLKLAIRSGFMSDLFYFAVSPYGFAFFWPDSEPAF